MLVNFTDNMFGRRRRSIKTRSVARNARATRFRSRRKPPPGGELLPRGNGPGGPPKGDARAQTTCTELACKKLLSWLLRKARADLDPRLLSWDGTHQRCLRSCVELGGQSVRPTSVNSTWASHYFWRCRFGNYGASPRFQEKVPPL